MEASTLAQPDLSSPPLFCGPGLEAHMADMQAPAPQAPTLADRILGAPDSLWKKIRSAVNVPTREAAAQLATQDQNIATRIEAILAGEDTVLGGSREPADTVLGGKKPAPRRSTADVLYGGGGGGITI